MTAEYLNHNIRIAGAQDAALLSQLGAQTFREAFGPHIPPLDMDSYVSATYNSARQMDELSDPSRKFLIAEREGIAVGYAILHAHEALSIVACDNPIELERIYLLQNSIGRGLGYVLACKCIEESRLSFHKSIWLRVWERNERAIVFYRKLGFETVGVRSKELGKSKGTDLIMARAI